MFVEHATGGHELGGGGGGFEGARELQEALGGAQEENARVGEESEGATRQEIAELLGANARREGNMVDITFGPDGAWDAKSRELQDGEEPGVRVHEGTLREGERLVDERRYRLEFGMGASMEVDEIKFRRFEELGVSSEMFVRHEEILRDIDLVVEMFDGSELGAAFGEAMKLRAGDVAKVAREVREGKNSDLTEAEVVRAQRDLAFMTRAMTVALGARGFQEGLEHGVWVKMESFRGMGQPNPDLRHAGLNPYKAVYRVMNSPLDDEGDFEDLKGEDRDFALADGLDYEGTLEIEIDPSGRINFSYVHDQESATKNYRQTVYKDVGGNVRRIPVMDLRIALDIDDTAPEGIACDMGRSEFRGERFERPGDLMGRVMEASDPENGSHTYEGFRRDMRSQFPALAQYLIVHQYLRWKRHLDEKEGRQVSPEEWQADLDRYRLHEDL